MNADGSDETRLTTATGDDSRAAWHPSGTKLVFDRYGSGTQAYDIYTLDLATRVLTPVVTGPTYDIHPEYSPDGTKLAWSRNFPNGNSSTAQLIVANADGSNPEVLQEFNAPSAQGLWLDWHPDGSKIEWAYSLGGFRQATVALDGTMLFEHADAFGGWAPSPSGNKLARGVRSASTGRWELWLAELDGTPTVQLTEAAVFDGFPAWQSIGFSYDTTDPVVTITSPTAGEVDQGSTVVADFSATDDIGPVTITAEVDGQTIEDGSALPTDVLGEHTLSVTAVDGAGNDTTETVTYTVVVVDTTDPVVTIASPTAGEVDQGSNVVADFSASDDIGPVSVTAEVDGEAVEYGSAVPTDVLGDHTLTVTAVDGAGNDATETVTYTVVEVVAVDTTPPVLDPSISDTDLIAGERATVSPNASDTESGIVSQSCGTVDASRVGSYQVECTATNGAGLTSSEEFGYTVGTRYPNSGSYAGKPVKAALFPINANGTSVFKKDTIVPLRFRLLDTTGNLVTNPGVVTGLTKVAETSLGARAKVNEPVTNGVPSSSFRYVKSGQRFVYLMGTTNLTSGVKYTYEVQLDDGSSFRFTFGVKP